VERGVCPTAAKAVTLRLPRISVSGQLGVYYAEKVAQYAQNTRSKRFMSHIRFPTGAPSQPTLISNGFRETKDQMNRGHDLDLSESRNIINDVTIRLPLGYMIYYRCFIDTDPVAWTVFEILSLIDIKIFWACGMDGRLAWPE